MSEQTSGNAFWDSLDDLDEQAKQRQRLIQRGKEVRQLQREAGLHPGTDVSALIAYHQAKTVVAMDDFYRVYLSKARAALNVALAGAKGNVTLDEQEIAGITTALEALDKATQHNK